MGSESEMVRYLRVHVYVVFCILQRILYSAWAFWYSRRHPAFLFLFRPTQVHLARAQQHQSNTATTSAAQRHRIQCQHVAYLLPLATAQGRQDRSRPAPGHPVQYIQSPGPQGPFIDLSNPPSLGSSILASPHPASPNITLPSFLPTDRESRYVHVPHRVGTDVPFKHRSGK